MGNKYIEFEKASRIRKLAKELAKEADVENEGKIAAVTPNVIRFDAPPQEMRFFLNIRFVKEVMGDEKTDLETIVQNDRQLQKKRLWKRGPFSDLTQEDLETIHLIEPQILKWMATDKRNAVLFATDPIRAIEDAGVKVEPNVLRKIQKIRNEQLKTASPFPPGIQLASVTVRSSEEDQ